MVKWSVGDSVDYEVCTLRQKCLEGSALKIRRRVCTMAWRFRCPAGERDLVPGVHRAQRLEEAVLQVRSAEVQELRGAHRQGEPRRPGTAPRRLGQRAPGIRKKEEAGQEVVRSRRPWSEGASMASIGPRRRPAKKPAAKSPAKKKTVAKPAARKPAAKPAAKKPAKKSCEPASAATPSPRHANPRRRPAKKPASKAKSPSKKKSPARKKKK